MAIDLFCYSSLPPEEAQEILDLLAQQHRGVFARRFLISEVTDLRNPATYYASVEVEIALEHELRASSSFLVSLNDKSAADLVPTVLILIKYALGSKNVIIMSDGILR